MFDSLERGENKEIKQANFKTLMAVGEPLVITGKFGNQWIKVNNLWSPGGNKLTKVKMWVSTEDSSGEIILHTGNLKQRPDHSLTIGSFSYLSKLDKKYPIILLNRDTNVFSMWSAGIGTALAVLGDKLLLTLAPMISAANQHKPVWAYTYDGGYERKDESSRKGWTISIIKQLGYSLASQNSSDELPEFIKDTDQAQYFVKKLI